MANGEFLEESWIQEAIHFESSQYDFKKPTSSLIIRSCLAVVWLEVKLPNVSERRRICVTGTRRLL